MPELNIALKAEINSNLLNSQLMDIYQPDSVSWWPLAPAWWLLLLLVLMLFLILLRFIYQKTALRRAVIKELLVIESSYEKLANSNQLALSLNMLLRRVVLSHKTLSCSPGLTGQAWLQYLDQTGGEKKGSHEFSQGVGQYLLSLPYQRHTSHVVDQELAQELLTLVRLWVKKNT